MEQQLRRRVRTSPEIRRAFQDSGESIASLAQRYGVNPKTVRRWRTRSSLQDCKTGPRPRSTVLALQAEATIVAIRRLTLLPLDDCFYALRTFVPGLTRASLHRCLRRHGVSRLPQAERAPPPGAFDVHLLEFDEGGPRLSLFIAIERASKFVVSRLYAAEPDAAIAPFLQALAESAPVRVRTIFTERREHFAEIFGDVARACAAIGAAHVSIEPRWTADQLARMDRIMMRAARSRAAELPIARMQERLEQFVAHFNCQCRLKTLGGQAPQAILDQASPAPPSAAPDRVGQPGERPSPTGGASPKGRGRDPEGTRETILAAARALLARVGPEGLSLSEVARAAGVNRGTAYQHFKSRKQLIAATAAWSSEQLHQAVFAALSRQPAGAGGHYAVIDVAHRLADFAMENPEMCQAWLFQFLSSPEGAKDPFWLEYYGAAKRFHATPMAQDNIDSEVLAITQLAGFFLWPTWARGQARDEAERRWFARRFVLEALRFSVYGVFRPEYQPEVVELLKTAAGESRRGSQGEPAP